MGNLSSHVEYPLLEGSGQWMQVCVLHVKHCKDLVIVLYILHSKHGIETLHDKFYLDILTDIITCIFISEMCKQSTKQKIIIFMKIGAWSLYLIF